MSDRPRFGVERLGDFVTIGFRGLTLRAPLHEALAENHRRRFVTYYDPAPSDQFAALCERYGSDKGSMSGKPASHGMPPHTYADFYERTFGHCRELIRNVFECGIGTNNPALESSMGANGKPGASLRVWRDYFPNAEIVGADIDRDILFTEDRIRTFHVDQTQRSSIEALWRDVGDVQFDLTIDDGLHEVEGGQPLLTHSLHRLKPNGLYVIEDIHITYMLQMVDWLRTQGLRYDIVTMYRDDGRLADNSLIVVRKPLAKP